MLAQLGPPKPFSHEQTARCFGWANFFAAFAAGFAAFFRAFVLSRAVMSFFF
jgi:hypothetical protein